MRNYRGTHLLGFFFAAGAMTSAFWWGIPHIVEPWLDDPRQLHGFLYDRSPIQWGTILVFCFILAILVHRALDCSSLLSSLARISSGRSVGGGTVPRLVADRFEEVRLCKASNGPPAAARYCSELSTDDEGNLDRVYGLLSNATQLMLALGFLGTVWGISQSIFGSFENLGDATTSELKEGLQSFTTALGTALDTTVLAIICSLIATVLSTLMQWLETNSAHQLEASVRASLWLDRAVSARDEAARRIESQLSDLRSSVAREIVDVMQPLIDRASQGGDRPSDEREVQ